ncbi:MAG: GGDEF domain-containing protein [Rhodocyclales bacterium]|nr:GGDEF domain-containing protein [Rhodocyclales bacterium]
MAESKQASEIEIARDTLRLLATRKIPPTPDNYRTLYCEIAGLTPQVAFPDREFKSLLNALPRVSADQLKFVRQFEAAVNKGSWENVGTALNEFIARSGEPPPWGNVIRDLLIQLDMHHAGLTPAKKKDAIDQVISGSGTTDVLVTRLQALIRSWSQQAPVERGVLASSEPLPLPPQAAPATAASAASGGAMPGVAAPWQGGILDLRDIIAQLVDNTLSIVLRDTPDLAAEATAIASAVREARNGDALVGLSERLKKLCYRALFVAEDQSELGGALLHLVQLIIDNIGELVVEDKWLTGQIKVVRDLIQQPLSLRRLDDVERRMKDVIVKQSALKKSLNEANDRLKLMLATFVDRLADFSETTSDYHNKIEGYADKISKAGDIAELTEVLDEVMRETRMVQVNAARSRDELGSMRIRVTEAEEVVARLQTELSNASELVRHDMLTGALNRKGLDEALEKEIARLRRQKGTLSMALLDIDNFKRLNEEHGKLAGDAALVHLSKIVQATVRPQDMLARYGGEEFVVLLPNTAMEDAVATMTRVQRELTREFFLNNNEKVLITFSCGVAEIRDAEDPYEALKRADGAMYRAKRAGKNRVIPA